MPALNIATAPQFPWDAASDRVLDLAAELDPNDRSEGAEHLRDVAESIREHRHDADRRN